jgi:hypothetical protein
MKKLFAYSVAFLITVNMLAQSPEKMSYQCVIRNPGGDLVTNQSVGIRISILQGTTSGTVVYSETYSPDPLTNINGLVTVEIGSGVPVTGSLSDIDWASGPYFIKTETDPAGGTNYTIAGTSQLLSVPYALYSKTAENGSLWLRNNPNIYFNTGRVGIGTSDPATYIHGHGSPIASRGQLSLSSPVGQDIFLSFYEANTFKSYLWYNIADQDLRLQNVTSGDLNLNPYGGNVGISTNTPGYTLDVSGDINYTGTLYQNGSPFAASWANISSKPTTISGYGITDAVTITGDQTITGIKTFNSDLLVNRLNIGLGKGAVYDNTVVGSQAFESNTTGGGNIAIGFRALADNQTGGANTANGYSALYHNSGGSQNTAIGSRALPNTGSGSSNTAIGCTAGFNASGNQNVFLGYQAGFYETGSNKLFIDNQGRISESDARVKSLIYGVFDVNPANQILTINGNVGIGTVTPNYKLDVRGTIGNNTTLYHSDIRWKTDVRPLKYGIKELLELNCVRYLWNANDYPEMGFDEGLQFGFIAQEFEKVIPELVKSDKEGYKSIDYVKLTPVLVEAIKEQQKQIESAEQENQQIKSELEELKTLVSKLIANKTVQNNK